MRRLGLLGTLCLAFAMQGSALAAPRSGDAAPDFTAPLSGGGSLTLSRLRGKPVYLNFFASWCPPCNAEAPDVNALQQKYRNRGFVVVGVDVYENPAAAARFLRQHRLSYKAVIDSGELRQKYTILGLPVHVFIDRRGKIRLYRTGEMSRAQMDAAIKSIL